MAYYTYEDFERAAKDSGLYGQFSNADLQLALKNPDAGMSILKYKQDYKNATTAEQRAQANKGAEGVRSSYGNYTGGGDGGSFHLDPLSPGSFNAGTAPTYSDQYAGDIADLYGQQLNYGSYDYGLPAPEYTSRYDDQIQQMLQELVSRPQFSYDAATDPLYAQYRKQYAREGKRATQDAMAAAAAATGGLPSSYAVNAAAQAGQYYSSQMTDKIPELYQLAYNKYLADYNLALSNLGAVQGAEQSDYAKYLTELQQYNTDRNFDYQAWMDQYNMIANNLQTASGLEQLDYTKYLNDLNQYNTDRTFNYGVLLDEISSQTADRQEQLAKAQLAASYGDYSMLQDMGIAVPQTQTREYVVPEQPVIDPEPLAVPENYTVELPVSSANGYVPQGNLAKQYASSTEEMYEEARSMAEEMKAAGASKEEILQMLLECRRKGAIGANEYAKLYNQYK